MAISERLSGALSENLLTLLAQSDEHGKLIASIVDPNLFEGELRIMAERCIAYWRTHGEAPKLHTPDLFADILEDPRSRRASTYRRVLEAMVQLSDEGVNTKYVLSELRTFTRLQKLKDAILRAGEALQQSTETTVQQVEEILGTILRARDFQFDPGIRLHEYEKLLSYLETQYFEFDTGIPVFDNGQVVPARGTLYLMLGSAGVGKTWGMVHIGKRAYLRRKKVLHITPEVGAEDVMQRYYQGLFSVAKRGDRFDVAKLERNRYSLVGIERQTLVTDFSFDDRSIKDELATRTQLLPRLRNIIIKQVAPRSLSTNGLRGMLDSLEQAEGFTPDMVIFDSAYLMKTEGGIRDYRLGLGRGYEDLRAIAIERNLAMVASHQISKEGARSVQPDATHVTEDWSIVATADIIKSIAATKAELKYGLARLYANKVRSQRGGQGALLTQSYDIGQFALDSMPLSTDYFDHLKDMEEAEGGPDETNLPERDDDE